MAAKSRPTARRAKGPSFRSACRPTAPGRRRSPSTSVFSYPIETPRSSQIGTLPPPNRIASPTVKPLLDAAQLQPGRGQAGATNRRRLCRPLAVADRRPDRQPGLVGRSDAANRSAAADWPGASQQLSRSGHPAGRIGTAARSASGDRRPGRAAGRRYLRHRAYARRAGGQAAPAQPAFAPLGGPAAKAWAGRK